MPQRSQTPVAHVVWDWNGTLFDDFGLTAEIARRTLETMGVPDVTGEDIRDSFRRPFSDFYAQLFGRPITHAELDYIRECYEVEYDAEVFGLGLQPDAEPAMDLVAAHPATQSLLSMAHDEQLQALVDHHRIRSRFVRVEGSPTSDNDGNKADRLVRHLAAISVEPGRTVIIGDTVDDHEAALSAGATSVLVTTGSTSRASLERTGAPVVDTLLAAATLVLGAHQAT